ncbi:nucleoside hydrolase-like protein [Blastopirellula marina DSM 3645]|uniref:Nucleoside hydrolase-like protein n=2 Tax=Blastopirellula marina TaxID=124 RepID=A3ZPL5_9BACT|nr:nucleoside hydrolase-like protein [Blastopirellula marina DSM 3645]
MLEGFRNVKLIARYVLTCAFVTLFMSTAIAQSPPQPIPLIFDTDIGNDCDDVLALGMIHALQSRGECELLAVTITKDNPLAAAFTDCVNTFYGRPDIPIGVCHSGVTPEPGSFNGLADTTDEGKLRYPHDLLSGETAVDAVTLLRTTLAGAEDHSVVICQVGFFTNLANLIDSPGDDISPLSGADLVKRKVRLLSVMAGSFVDNVDPATGQRKRLGEYNVIKDLAAARRLANRWPTPIIWSGYEIGIALRYPYRSIVNDYNYAAHHPLVESYNRFTKPPHHRPTWDLTTVLYPVRPDRGYFELSPAGDVTIDENGYTNFVASPKGRDHYLIAPDAQKERTLEALTLLSSQPPE